MTKNKYEYYNPDFHKIIENIKKNNLTIKDLSEYFLKNNTSDKSQVIKELLRLNNIEDIIYGSEIIDEKNNFFLNF